LELEGETFRPGRNEEETAEVRYTGTRSVGSGIQGILASSRQPYFERRRDSMEDLDNAIFTLRECAAPTRTTSTPAVRRSTMEDRDRASTVIYTLPDDARPMSSSFTPAAGRTMMEPIRVLESIDFDELKPMETFARERFDDRRPMEMSARERPDDLTSITKLLENVGGLRGSRPMPMKPGKFDGTGSLESFLVQFDVCARHNKWTDAEKADFLRCSLEKAATQLLWDFGAQPSAAYEELVGRLRERYGTDGQAETFRTQLHYRRQRANESLSDLLHEIRRLVVLAYPVPSNETTQILARDAYLEAMRDRELSLKVREREPKTIDEAYRTALRLEAYQQTRETDDRRRPPNQVRATQETDFSARLQEQLDRFLATQRDDQRSWQREMESKIDRQLRELQSHAARPMDDEPGRDVRPGRSDRQTSRRGVTCFNCGRAGHFARDCRQRRRNGEQPNNAEATASGDPTPEETVARNHTTRPLLPNRASNNAIYIRGTINGRPQACLIDTGSEVSLIPFSAVEGLDLRPCNRFLMAANGSDIRVLGEVRVPIKVRGNFNISTAFLVSDQIAEPMLGMDWLREHRCRLGFGTGALFVGRRRISLIRGNGSTWCRRVIVAEEVLVSPKCQRDVPVKTLYGDITTVAPAWMTEAKEIQPGVHLARVVIGDRVGTTQVRVVNLSEDPVRLIKDQMLSGLHPVEVEPGKKADKNVGSASEISPCDFLLADLPEEVAPEIRGRLSDLLEEYRDVFSVSEGDIGRTSITTHKIDTGEARPVRQPLRRQPLPHRAAVDEQLDRMLAEGSVEPAVSEWAANVVLARKKDGTLRFCIDYRQLNEKTKKDSYPLPRIDECLDALSSGGWFSTLDLRSGYHQVAMDPKDADKTAFVTRRGIFRWKVMPFGLCNAPATFQRLMDIVLSGLNFEICLVYLDDVIIFGSTPEQHLDRLKQVFQRLREANLKLKPSKCRLMRRTVSFLGHVVTQEGVAVDPSKIRDVVEWPTPRRLKDVRAFLGLCSYYRRFIRDFSVLASPLFALTKKGRAFVWDETCREAFDRLKTVLTTTPILALPRDEGGYVLDCDACDVGIGAVLSQRIEGEERVIAYGSRLLSAAEKNYCVTRKELLAIVYFTKQYRQYLLGRPFLLRTDHAALQWLQRTPEPIGQQGRWLERLAEFEFQVVHRAGRKHGNADALSRKPCRQCGSEIGAEVAAVTEVLGPAPASADGGRQDAVDKAQREDPDLSKVRSWLEVGAQVPNLVEILGESEAVKIYWHQREQLSLRDGVMYRRTFDGVEQVVVPKVLREEFLRLAHTGMTGGHLGVRRTRWQVRRRAYWAGWSKEVKRFCRCCPPCNRYHRGQPPRQGPLQPLPCGEPWERLGVDITGPHPRSRRGHIYILTVMDYFTKFVEAVPMANQEATTVARALMENVIVRYGAPIQILTDQGTNFDGNLFRELCRLMGIDKARTSSYHPSCNGLIERFHRTLNAMLGKVVSSHQRDWDEVLPHVLAAYRASQHETTGFSPNMLLFGRETRAPLDLVFGRPPDAADSDANYTTYVRDLGDRLESAYQLVRESLRVAAERRKRQYDLRVRPKEFAVGDRVWYFTPRRYRGRTPKWQQMYTGPYAVDDRLGALNYRIRKSANSRPFVVHVDKLRPCFEEGTADGDGAPEEAPREVEELGARPRRTTRRPVRFQ
jgi:transposase InsO family protein/predicted aspartyl protease